MTSDLHIIHTPNEIDLTRHGLLEAHAGTGKTYTIVQMVLRILERPQAGMWLHIREILLVTFTEKAAGELKSRIREGLEERIKCLQKQHAMESTASGADLISHLSNCLNNLHEAYIGTIHGVCLRLLQTWPFETGVPFNTQMVNDDEGLESALRDSIREDWQHPETLIPWALEQISQRNETLSETDFRLICQLAKNLLDPEHAILDRTAMQSHTLASLRDELEQAEQTCAGPLCADFIVQVHGLLDALREVIEKGSLEADRLNLFQKRYQELQQALDIRDFVAQCFSDPIKVGRSKLVKATDKKNTALIEISRLCENVKAHDFLEINAHRLQLQQFLPIVLASDAALILRDRWLNEKSNQGLLSFLDMLRLMHRAVMQSSAFCASLRQRLRYGIIDEFQDTSVLQWQIFEKLFLGVHDANAPLLYLVGDPKQSIYSFQGADVQSYLAARDAILLHGGRRYGLVCNYRSLPGVVQGYNLVLGKPRSGEDWFRSESIAYPMLGEGGDLAQTPPRLAPAFSCDRIDPVQVIRLQGSTQHRRREYARQVSQIIRSYVNKTIAVPQKDSWIQLTLKPEHFAVIIESHHLAEVFLEQFQSDGIPAVKYKMEGVFTSDMARDLHALLQAIEGDHEFRLAALLTRFFNKHPAEINPERDLEASSPFSLCFEEWTALANAHRWALLFQSIQQQTKIRERISRLVDGERHLADLRQLIDYCLEQLLRSNRSLNNLVEHLGQLLAGNEQAGQDKNLHLLATDQSSVRILTMHASKGLEFTIVFVAIGNSNKPPRDHILKWIDNDHQLHVLPFLSLSAESLVQQPEIVRAKLDAEHRQNQERRRLLYVALTRPQAALFLPYQIEIDEQKFSEQDLTPVLHNLIEDNALKWYVPDPCAETSASEAPEQFASLADIPPEHRSEKAILTLQDSLRHLHLADRISHQTSYTELSRGMEHDRVLGSSEEEETADDTVSQPTITCASSCASLYAPLYAPSLLPRGKDTGDALHLLLEHCLTCADLTWVDPAHAFPEDIPKRMHQYLQDKRALQRLHTPEDISAAEQTALHLVRTALHTNYDLGLWGTIRLADLPQDSRRPELEFQLQVSPDWVHGFMDLVFRLPEPACPEHPWRYFILDWKSNSLPAFQIESIEQSIRENHYDLQARVYCHALERFLQGMLGTRYQARHHLGGAVYVYLRAFESAESVPVWIHPAQPVSDALFVQQQLRHAFPRGQA